MAGRTRTTKRLAQRIDRDYFKRRFPMPRWRFLLSLILTGLALLWVGWRGLAHGSDVFSGGPIRSSHRMFSQDCGACHVNSGGFTRTVSDNACQRCHDGPAHQANQTFTPACGGCHVEHQGAVNLSRISDTHCTQCHADLKTKGGNLKFAAHIQSFTNGHPEFAVLRSGNGDPGQIKFNHQVHLKSGLRSLNGFVQLTCQDCHQTAGIRPALRFGATDPYPPGQLKDERRLPHAGPNADMAPVNFMAHCSGCHPLVFDARIPAAAPHQSPEIVRDYLVRLYNAFVTANPGEFRPIRFEWRIPSRPPEPPAKSINALSARLEGDAEQLLWNKSCKECHSVTFSGSVTLPSIPRTGIASRWMKDARFDHGAHAFTKCETCHDKAVESRETSDLLLPGIQTCQGCHIPGKQTAAEGRCFECHDYHDWSKEKPVQGKFVAHNAGFRH